MGYRIPENHKGCRYLVSWWEDVVGDGGSRMEMQECAYIGGKETIDYCNPLCPAFETMPTVICQKHDIEFLENDYCTECYAELYYAELYRDKPD